MNMEKLGELVADNILCLIISEQLSLLKQILDSNPELKIGQTFQAVHYIRMMYSKYADISKTQDFESIGQLIKEMTDLTTQFAEPIKTEMHDLMTTRQQLEGSLHSWRMQQHSPPADENAKKIAELRETTTMLAEKSVACETEFNGKLAEAAQKQLAMSEVVTQTEVYPLQTEALLTTITEKTADWIWVNSRLDAQSRSGDAGSRRYARRNRGYRN
jgi:rubrerythrin